MRWKPRGLSLFTRDSAGDLMLAAWHSPHSLTWRWFITFKRFRMDEGRAWPILLTPYRNNCGGWGGIRIPWIGFLDWHWQKPMWYRDLFISLDERHQNELRDQFRAGRAQGQRDILEMRGPLQ